MIVQYDKAVTTAVRHLKAGKIVALPTETVYGLAVDPYQPAAVRALYALKQRPEHKPLTLAIASVQEIQHWVQPFPEHIMPLLEHFWPGPLTCIFPCSRRVARMVYAHNATVGIRCSSGPLVQHIILGLGHAIGLTSANLHSQCEAVTPEQVKEWFGDSVMIFEDRANALSGIPSTILDCSTNPHKIVRLGAIRWQECAAILPSYFSNLYKE